jgi:hypothetical protein
MWLRKKRPFDSASSRGGVTSGNRAEDRNSICVSLRRRERFIGPWEAAGHSASPLEQHMGLGKSAEIVSREIQWPGDAQPQRFASVPKKQAIEIRQSASDYRVIERPRYQLGGNHGR